MLKHTNQFDQIFKMSQFMFENLLEGLCECLTVSYKHSMASSSCVGVEERPSNNINKSLGMSMYRCWIILMSLIRASRCHNSCLKICWGSYMNGPPFHTSMQWHLPLEMNLSIQKWSWLVALHFWLEILSLFLLTSMYCLFHISDMWSSFPRCYWFLWYFWTVASWIVRSNKHKWTTQSCQAKGCSFNIVWSIQWSSSWCNWQVASTYGNAT